MVDFRRRNPPWLAGLGQVELAIAAASAAAALAPQVEKLFGVGTAAPVVPAVDPNALQRDLQAQIAAKTQAAVAAKEAQAAVQVAQTQATSMKAMMLYGLGAVAVIAGVMLLISSSKKSGEKS